MERKTVILIVASEGYQQIEYNKTKMVLEEGGMCVRTASDKSGMAVAKDKTTTKIDLTINNIIPDRYAGIFFIGGSSVMELLDNPISYKLIKQMVKEGKLVGAICIAPRILAKADVLTGKHATGWDGDNELEGVFKKYGVIRERKDVVVDGNIVTATCPAAAQDFGKAILKLLQEKQ